MDVSQLCSDPTVNVVDTLPSPPSPANRSSGDLFLGTENNSRYILPPLPATPCFNGTRLPDPSIFVNSPISSHTTISEQVDRNYSSLPVMLPPLPSPEQAPYYTQSLSERYTAADSSTTDSHNAIKQLISQCSALREDLDHCLQKSKDDPALRNAAQTAQSILSSLKSFPLPAAESKDEAEELDSKNGQHYLNGIQTKRLRRQKGTAPQRCHSCRATETPEWRRGPDGARTLCNACGLHYAKLIRKRSLTVQKSKQHFGQGSRNYPIIQVKPQRNGSSRNNLKFVNNAIDIAPSAAGNCDTPAILRYRRSS